MLRVRLLGGLALAWDQDPLPMIPSRAARSLFAYLVTYRDRPHTRDLLAGTFWPDLPDATARRRLSRALWQIRHVLRPFVLPQDRQAQDQASLPSPVLVAEGDTIQLDPDLPLWLDVEEFTRHNAQCTRGGPDAIVHCELCIEHYRGEFLAGYYDDWVVVERERLREMFLEALARLVEGHKGRGEYERALLYARRLAAEDPWREEAHREVMRLCHLLGQDAEALKQFEVCRQALAEELGAEPSPETTALANEIATRSGLSEPPILPSTARPVTMPLLERPDRLPLVGRQSELAELLRQVEAALEGSGGLTVIYGEAGVGKSRLLRELALNAQWRGLHTVWGCCYELAAPPAYQPLVEALRSGLPALSDSGLQPLWRAELSRLLPELTTDAGSPPLSPEEEKRRLLEAIARAFVALAEAAPHLVLLEDVHWMDSASLEALRYLLPRLTDARLLLVITVRPGELAGQELAYQPAAALSAMEDTHLSRRLELRQLDLAETEELVQRALDLEQPAPRFSARLYAETEGNPFYLIEMLWALVEEGLLYRDEAGEWNTPWDESTEDYAELPLPAGVVQSVKRRLDRLPASLNELLDLAAVLGRGVDFEMWLAASGRDEEALLTAGDELCARGLLLAADPDYVFAHDQIRRVAYERLALPRRRFYHLRVAQALTHLVPDEPEPLAYHWTRAEVWDKAADYHQQAGDRARGVHANAQAVDHYTQALEALSRLSDPVDPILSYQLHLARAAAYDLLGEREAQVQDLRALEALAEVLDDDRRRAEVALCQASYAEFTGDFPMTIAAAQAAIDLGQAAQDVTATTTGYLQWGQALWRQGDYEAARPRLEQALDLARAAGLRQMEADSLRNLGIICWYLADYAEARACYEQSLHISREIGDRRGEGATLNNLGLNNVTQGDHAGARAYYEQALRIFQEIGDRQGEGRVLAYLGLLSHHLDDDEAARDYSQQALLIAQEVGDRSYQGYALTNLGHALAGLGRLAEATAFYQQALALRRKFGEHRRAMEPLAGLARVSLAQGDLTQAQIQVEEILNHLETQTLDGTDEPFRVYLTCYRILRTSQDPRAQTVLNTARGLLQDQAAKITDGELRRAFLENVAVHREIVAAYQELHASPERRPGAERITISLPRADAPLGRPLRDDEYVTVTWTVAAPGDEAIAGKVARRHQRILRLLGEAQAQGAAPTHSHLAEALGVSQRTIERDMVLLRRQEQVTIPPTRGKMSE
jgi:predicted ATPase/DNA-binding SARP family transcriptional activator